MFGYIKPLQPELKVKEYEFYRSVYCGLCGSLGKNTGCSSRFALSYDLIFLALVRMAVHKENFKIARRRCLLHPIRPRNRLLECRAVSYCAYATAALAADKLEDDRHDERGIKRFAALLLSPFRRLLRRRAEKFEGLGGLCAPHLSDLSRLENENCPSLDRPAEAFGGALAEVCALDTGAPGSPEERICRDIGRHLGRFIYIADAADDLPKDIKNGSYNPIAASYGVKEIDAPLARELYEALLLECRELERSLSLLDFTGLPEAEAILSNITTLGMPSAALRILGEDAGKTQEEAERGYISDNADIADGEKREEKGRESQK